MWIDTIGRTLIGLGLFLALMGLLLVLFSRLTGGQGWRLPGDVVLRRDNITVYVPIATSILLSLLLTALLYLVSLLGRH